MEIYRSAVNKMANRVQSYSYRHNQEESKNIQLFTRKASEEIEVSSDMYEEICESDSEQMCTYFPFIKIENDGSILIDGQPSSQDASQMSIESAEVLVLPFSGIVDQLDTLEDSDKFQQVIEEVVDESLLENASTSDDASISETFHHDHNYEDMSKRQDGKEIDISFMLDPSDTNRNICSLCDKSFNTPASLKRHLRIHTGERPFQCQICEKYFSQQSNLWKHVRTHTGERPFECPHCQKRFSQRANMKKHLIIHTGERPFVCFLCTRGFTQQANLSKHMRLHTGEKPFACSYCDKRFTQRSNLQKHEHLHEGIKPYTCEICFQAFTQQSNLRKHEMMHNNIKKFVCELCNKGYVQKVSLLKHKQRCIGEPKALDSDVAERIELLSHYGTIEAQCLDDDEEAIILQADNDFTFTIN